MGGGVGAGTRGLGESGRGGGALGGGPGRALTVGLPGQLLHYFGLQLAVRFPHPRRPRPLPPGGTRRGAQRERIGRARAGPRGRGGAHGGRRAGGPGRAGPRLCLRRTRGPGWGLRALRCATRPVAPRPPGTLRGDRARGRRRAGRAVGRRPLWAPRRGLRWAGPGADAAAELPVVPGYWAPRHMLAAAPPAPPPLLPRLAPPAPRPPPARTGAPGWTRSRHSALAPPPAPAPPGPRPRAPSAGDAGAPSRRVASPGGSGRSPLHPPFVNLGRSPTHTAPPPPQEPGGRGRAGGLTIRRGE